MAIKDLRKMTEKVDVKEIQKQSFLEAYETILAENVVMTGSEFKRIVSEAVQKERRKTFKEAQEKAIEMVERNIDKAFGGYSKSIKEAILNPQKSDLIIATNEDLELAEEMYKDEIYGEIEKKLSETLGEENYQALEEAISKRKEVLIVSNEQLDEAEEKLVEELDEKIEEAIGEENFKLISKAISEGEEVYVISEDLIPSIEEKMKEKIKEEFQSEEGQKALKESGMSMTESYESKTGKTLAEKLIEDAPSAKNETAEEATLAGKLV